MVKISVPFSGKEEVLPLIEAGADELYCGYLSPEWIKRYTSLEFERKGGIRSNFTDLQKLREAVDLAHKKNTPVYLTLNGLYVNSQYPLLIKIINQLEKIPFDAFIIADIGLLLTLIEMQTKKQIHISTGATVFNSGAVEFYRNLGAARIILDRQMTLASMKNLSEKHADIDFEVFILATLCVYIDGFCTFMHTSGMELKEKITKNYGEGGKAICVMTSYDPMAQTDACAIDYSVKTFDADFKRTKGNNIRPTFFRQLIDGLECGACALYDILNTRVKSVKIVGRQHTPEIRLKNTEFIRSALDILKKNNNVSRSDFINAVQELYRFFFKYKNRCKGNNCYYQEALYTKAQSF